MRQAEDPADPCESIPRVSFKRNDLPRVEDYEELVRTMLLVMRV